VDSTTNAEIVAETALSTLSSYQVKAARAGGFVWLFGTILNGGVTKTLVSLKFDPTNPTTAPVQTTYYTSGATEWDHWDVIENSSGGITIGLLTATATATDAGLNPANYVLTKLDTATGAFASSPGRVGQANCAAFVGANALGFNFYLLKDDSGGVYGFVNQGAGTWKGARANKTTLVNDLAQVSLNQTVMGSANGRSQICGYRDPSNGNVVLFSGSGFIGTGSTTTVSQIFVGREVYDSNLVSSFGAFINHCALVGEPVFVNGTPYIPVQYDDRDVTTDVRLQAAYYLLNAVDFTVQGRAIYGLGGDVYQHGFTGSPVANAGHDMSWIGTTRVSGNVVSIAVNTYDGVIFRSRLLSWDFGASVSPPVPILQGDAAAFASGWPSFISGASNAIEWPSQFPNKMVATNVVAANPLANGVYQVAVLFGWRDKVTGRIIRSAPSATKTVTTSGGNQVIQITVDCIGVTSSLTGAEFFFEPYVSAVGGTVMFRQPTTPNSTTAVNVVITINSANYLTGTEELYTQVGGEVANDPPPPSALATFWRNRMFVANSEVPGEIWPSKEIQVGLGPQFSGGLAFFIPGDTGPPAFMCPLDHNWMVIGKKDGIWPISGAGPDLQGGGNYEPVRIGGNFGSTNPNVVSTKYGVFFQNVDGRLCLITPGLQVIEDVAGPVFTQTSAVTGMVDIPAMKQVRIFQANGQCLVLDTAQADPANGNPYGEWYIDTNKVGDGGCCVHNNVPHHVTSAGEVRYEVAGQFFDGTNTPILRKVTLPLLFGGARGHERVYRGQLVGQYISPHSMRFTVNSYEGAAGEAGSSSETWDKTVIGAPLLFEFKPTRGKVTVFDLTLEDIGSDLTAGSTWDAVAFEVGVRPGLPHVGSGQKL
jgi:hypothetical protein